MWSQVFPWSFLLVDFLDSDTENVGEWYQELPAIVIGAMILMSRRNSLRHASQGMDHVLLQNSSTLASSVYFHTFLPAIDVNTRNNFEI